jgi:RNA polymerase sigma-70 factor (ECF subfamily)
MIFLIDFAPILDSDWDIEVEEQGGSVLHDVVPMTDVEDQILVHRALHADPESFGRLCRRYYPSLVAVADSILMDHHLAEDAAQETLAAACRQLPRLKKPERFGPWIVAICRNVAKDMRREQQRQRTPLHDCEPQVQDCREDRQDEVLAEALRRLPKHLREVVFLRFYNELSYQQMAQVLGATEEMVDGRLRRAKKKIAAFMKTKGIEL